MNIEASFREENGKLVCTRCGQSTTTKILARHHLIVFHPDDLKTTDLPWADGESNLFGWTVIGPCLIPETGHVGLLVQHLQGDRRVIFYDPNVSTLRSIPQL